MRFFMDGRYIRTDYHDGISRFSHSLIHAVAALQPITVMICDEQQRALLPDNVEIITLHEPTSALEPFVARQLNKHRPDVVFSPMQTMGSAGRNFGLILTLHDLIYYQHRTPPRDLPQVVRGLWYLYHLSYTPQRMLLNRADAVATVSKTSQRLIRKHRLTTKPVHVISNAPQSSDQPRDPHAPRTKDLVYMGSFMEYKNVETLIMATAKLPEYRLHLCSPISAALEEAFEGLLTAHGGSAQQLVFHRGITDAAYRSLLREATALVTASRSEGYGLPVAEAMAEGTPVVLSDLEIFKEIGGQDNPGARFFELAAENSAQQIAQHVTALEDDAIFEQASRGAVSQARHFTWETSAHKLLDIAESIHQRRSRRGASDYGSE